VIKNYE